MTSCKYWINQTFWNVSCKKANKQGPIENAQLNLWICILNWVDCILYSDREAWANIVGPDQMPQNVASFDLNLHCLPLNQQFLYTDTEQYMR